MEASDEWDETSVAADDDEDVPGGLGGHLKDINEDFNVGGVVHFLIEREDLNWIDPVGKSSRR